MHTAHRSAAAAGTAATTSSRAAPSCLCPCSRPLQKTAALHRTVQLQSTNNGSSSSTRVQAYDIVSDAMSSGSLYSCSPDDTVDAALEMLVQHRITGLPVVDAEYRVVGVVSDYDLLALDKLGQTKDDRQLFPQADETWQAFKEVKKLLAKSSGKLVKDVMTAKPFTVRPETGLDEAATMLLSKKIHRLPVVDGQGKLVGVLSRGNLVKAALAVRKAANASAGGGSSS